MVDVLEAGQDRCLQVLTHPVWWQEEQMPPWDRILRSVVGRADATLVAYETALARDDRHNLGRSAARFDLQAELEVGSRKREAR